MLLAAEFLTSGGVDPRLDFNGDDVIDIVDLSLMAPHYMHGCQAL